MITYLFSYVFIKILKVFFDKSFPATLSSLLDPQNNNGGMDTEKVKLFRTLRWKRASEMFPKSSLWLEKIKPEFGGKYPNSL